MPVPPPASTAPSPEACCAAPLTGAPLDAAQAGALASVLKAVAEPTRLRLLSLVAAHEGAEACVCELTGPVGLSQPTVSHHLKVLVDAGLLTRDKRGVWAYYALVPGALDAVAAVLSTTGAASVAPAPDDSVRSGSTGPVDAAATPRVRS